jgi:hypothetical protein
VRILTLRGTLAPIRYPGACAAPQQGYADDALFASFSFIYFFRVCPQYFFFPFNYQQSHRPQKLLPRTSTLDRSPKRTHARTLTFLRIVHPAKAKYCLPCCFQSFALACSYSSHMDCLPTSVVSSKNLCAVRHRHIFTDSPPRVKPIRI